MTALPAYPGRFDTTQVASADEITARLKHAPGWLVDARAGERFRGEVEPLDPVAGHVPGAVNRPFALNVADGRLRDAQELRAELQGVIGNRDPQQVVLMCGSGVTACHLLAMESAGLSGARIYADSWSGWVAPQRSEQKAVERGASQSRAAGSTRMAMPSNHRRPQVMERGSTLQRHPPIDSTPCRPTVGTHQRQKSVEGGVGPGVRGMDAAASPRGEGALLASTASRAPEHSRQRLGRPGDLRRPPQPGPPCHPMDSLLLPASGRHYRSRAQPCRLPNRLQRHLASTRAQGNNGPGSRLRATLSVGSSLAGTCSRSSWSCPAIRCSDG